MRVAVGKAMRVGLGDEVTIHGQLVAPSRLGRLFIFAKEGDSEFAPYVQHLSAAMVVGDAPFMYSPMSMRLVENRPTHELSFIADIDGYIRVMQEVDTASEVKARVRIKRKINPALGWKEKLSRRLNGILSWAM